MTERTSPSSARPSFLTSISSELFLTPPETIGETSTFERRPVPRRGERPAPPMTSDPPSPHPSSRPGTISSPVHAALPGTGRSRRGTRGDASGTRRARGLVGGALARAMALVVFGAGWVPAALAEEPASASERRLPGGIEVEAADISRTDGDLVLQGSVTLRWRESRFQADRIVVREDRFVEAEGHVLVVWGGNRISGTRMTYDLEQDRGVIENAIGQVEPEYYFTAEEVEKVGDDLVYLDSANVTTCTQPVPYWSFSVSSARIRIDGYARLWNLRLKTGKMPAFYLPFMLWPVKKERSAGLLFPQIGGTRNRGEVISQGLFVPLGDSADVTVVGEYYTRAGFGGGAEVRYIPNRKGKIDFNGFFIMDEVVPNPAAAECTSLPCLRWRATYRQTQEFRNGFRMVADINQVSDFEFFSDFERDLRLVSSPSVLARVEFSRNAKWTSVNVRELRREQFVSGDILVQQTLPELEWRGRSRQLGDTPLYLSFESSLASIQQDGRQIDADYIRGDFFPTLSMPVSPFPWLDVSPQASYRWTYYSQRRDSDDRERILDDDIVRGVASAGLEVVGPKFTRIFRGPEPEAEPRFKHTIEPRVFYGFSEGFERGGEIIELDEVDRAAPTTRSFVNYGIRSRLFARRSREEPSPPPDTGEAILMPDGHATTDRPEVSTEARAEPKDVGGEAAAPPVEPVEIASLDISQRRNLDEDQPLSRADLDRDGVLEETSLRSSISLAGRYNPSRLVSFDLRTSYHILYRTFESVSFSGNLSDQPYRLRFSLVHRQGLGVTSECLQFDAGGDCLVFADAEDSTQLRLDSGLRLFRGKLRFALDGSYNADPAPGASRFPDRRVRVEYYTQCCGFLAELLARDFVQRTRRDFRFTVDLRGIGKFLDLHHGTDR